MTHYINKLQAMGKRDKGQSGSRDSNAPEFGNAQRLAQSIGALLGDLQKKLKFNLDDSLHPLHQIRQWCDEFWLQHESLTMENSTLKASLKTAKDEAAELR